MSRRRLPNAKVAPKFNVPEREVVAVEHPAIIQNIDNAVKTFGRNNPFERILACIDPEECVPLYLRFRDPTCVPILSHNSATNNVLLKLTVPKRTGRKRKRGSQEPYRDDAGAVLPRGQSNDEPIADDGQLVVPAVEDDIPPAKQICSQARLDKPSSLLRKLQDNVGKYTVEAVARIRQSHRFRGMADFHQSTSHTNFIPRVRDTLLTGSLDKIKEFKFDLRRGWQPNEELLPPPNMSTTSLPFNWGFLQNPHIVEELDPITGERILTNLQTYYKVKVQYVSGRIDTVPDAPTHQREPNDPSVQEVVNALREALEERPAWSRRAIMNRISHSPNLHLLKQALPYVGYRFKDGPFRDAIIRYGFDPRGDPKYREYQTIYFLLSSGSGEQAPIGTAWHDPRKHITITKTNRKQTHDQTHIFDGKSMVLDGKIWHLCDITDPLLAKLIREAPVRETFDAEYDGWYCNGTLAKIRTIMRMKIIALRAGKEISDDDFKPTLETPDIILGSRLTKHISLPIPNIKLSAKEIQQMREAGGAFSVTKLGRSKRSSGYVGPLRHPGKRLGDNTKQSSLLKNPQDGPGAESQTDIAAFLDPALVSGEAAGGEGAAASMESPDGLGGYIDDIDAFFQDQYLSDRSGESDDSDEEDVEDEEEEQEEEEDEDDDD